MRPQLGAYPFHIDKRLSMLRKSFVFNCPERASRETLPALYKTQLVQQTGDAGFGDSQTPARNRKGGAGRRQTHRQDCLCYRTLAGHGFRRLEISDHFRKNLILQAFKVTMRWGDQKSSTPHPR